MSSLDDMLFRNCSWNNKPKSIKHKNNPQNRMERDRNEKRVDQERTKPQRM